MKRRLIFQTLIASLVVFLLASCSTVETRIAERPEVFQRMSPSDQALVTNARVREGMSRDAVYIAWGAPSQRGEGRYRKKSVETWIYYDTSVGNFYPSAFAYGPYAGFGFGSGFGGGFGYRRGFNRFRGGFGYDPFWDPFFYNRVAVLRYPERTVSFENGRVIGFQFFPKPYLF